MNGLGVSARRVGDTSGAEAVEIHASADDSRRRAQGEKLAVEQLTAHQFPAHQCSSQQSSSQQVAAKDGAVEETEELITEPVAAELVATEQPAEPYLGRLELEDLERQQRIYRGRTIGMLRRYLRYSIEAGRLPSMLGAEFFRAKVTAYTVVTFEDRVIFVHDMEKCLDRLDDFSRQLIARHILQEHDLEATGRLLGCTERTVRTYVPIVLDLFSDILLEVGLLERIVSNRENSSRNSCQGGLESEISASDCDDGKYKF
jgi:hypothetical protein